jgi:HlyD family secretion protein
MNRTARKRIVFWGVLITLGAAGLMLSLRTPPLPVDVTAAVRGPLRVTLDHEGRTRVRERYVVAAPVAGRVLRIETEPGDPVTAGRTVLARVLPGAPALLDARARAGAEAQVQVADANLARARAQRDEAREASRYARAEADRMRNLNAQGLATSQQLDGTEADARVKARALEAADAAVEAAARDLDVARAMLYQGGAPSAAGIVEVRAPVSGVLLRRLHESEAVVAQGEPLVEVADLADLEVVADFLSTDAVRIRPGMPALIDRWGGAASLSGRVARVEPSGFMKISALGVEEQRVWVVIAFADARDAWAALGDGYRVEARVIVWQQPDVLKVAAGSLFRHGEAWAVFVVDGGVARLRTVTIGQRNDVEAEVTGGLAAGAAVIAYPSDQIQDGARVETRR